MAAPDVDVDTSQLDKAIHELDDIYQELKYLKNKSSPTKSPLKQEEEAVYSSPKSTPLHQPIYQVPPPIVQEPENEQYTFQKFRSSSARNQRYLSSIESNNTASARNWPPIIVNHQRKLSSPAATSSEYYTNRPEIISPYQNYSKSFDKRRSRSNQVVTVERNRSKTFDRRLNSHPEIIIPPPPYFPPTSPVKSDSGSDYDDVATSDKENDVTEGIPDYDEIPDPVPVRPNDNYEGGETIPYKATNDLAIYSRVEPKKKRTSVVFVEMTESSSRRHSNMSGAPRRHSSHSSPDRNQTVFAISGHPPYSHIDENQEGESDWDDDEWDVDSKGTSRRASRAAVIATNVDGGETSFGEPRAFPTDTNKNNNGSYKDGDCMWCRILMAIFTLLACLLFIFMVIGYIILGLSVDRDIRAAIAAANPGT